MSSFKETGLNDQILTAIAELGFENPTPIQAETIPVLLSSKRDMVALAQTGTGKTAAFGLPALHMTDLDDNAVQTLVLCPTRELCLQIVKDLNAYSKHMKKVGVVAVYGGSSIDTQIKALKKNAQIVVGTPGRTVDLIKRKRLKLQNVRRVVLDEADEMLSMGFKDDLDLILEQAPEDKQTLLFSATMSTEVGSIAKRYMTDPLRIAVARTNAAAENVRHEYYMVQARDKYEALKRLADINPDVYGIVFCRTRRETKEIAGKLMNDGYNADALHGDLSQAQRDEVMRRFRSRHLQMLVATDVAARGLDVDDLTHVINFNLPDDEEVYIHRSGRTGRAGKSGISIVIVHTREIRRIKDIERRFKIEFFKETVPDGKEICAKQLYTLIDKIQKVEVDEKQIGPFLPEIYKKLEWLDRESLIKHFVSAEFNRFLAYYKNSKDLNASERKSKDKKDRSVREKRERVKFSRFFINAGSKNHLNPARLIGMINEALDSSEAPVGKIEILRNFSFFEIDQDAKELLVKNMNGVNFEGIAVELEAAQGKVRFGGESERGSRDRDEFGSKGGWRKHKKKDRNKDNKNRPKNRKKKR